MTADVGLTEIGIPEASARKLEHLAIRGVRQLFARLQVESDRLQRYLGLSDDQFRELSRRVEGYIQDRHPEDELPHVQPAVNKRGVAVDRLHDPDRPRYVRSGRAK
jgi:hypothetical protein